jgi:glycosyltransferase involved in cell wall biosynthesis
MLSEFYGKTGGVNTHMLELSRFLEHEVILSNSIESFESMSEKPDIIHVHHAFTPLTFKVLRRAKKEGVPVVVTNHSIAPLHNIYFWRLLKLGFRYLDDASAIIAVSRTAKKFVSNFTSRNVEVIPNGVDTEKFRPMKVEKQHKTLLYVGRLSARKGVQLLIPLLSRCLSEEVELIIAGKDEMHMIPFLKLQQTICKNVRILGFVSDHILPKLYNYADLFLMPSLTMESFGIAAIESMACATPVIATKSGALPEIVKEGGVISNLWAFPEVIESLLLDPCRIKGLGERGRKLVEEEYSWSVVAGKIEKIYFQILDGESDEKYNT